MNYDICKSVTYICELCDGVAHSEAVNRTYICYLLKVVCIGKDSLK